jgi:hypothetical protein
MPNDDTKPPAVVDSLDVLSVVFESRVGHTFTEEDNRCIQGLIERMLLLNKTLKICSGGAMRNVYKKYQKLLKAQGGLEYAHVIPPVTKVEESVMTDDKINY